LVAKPCQPTVGDPSKQEASEHILAWSMSDFLGSRSLIMPSYVGMPMLRGWPLLGCQANHSQQEASEHSLAWSVSDFLGSRSLIMPSHVGMPMHHRGWPLMVAKPKTMPTDLSESLPKEHIVAKAWPRHVHALGKARRPFWGAHAKHVLWACQRGCRVSCMH
jgi:hypothetical protein